MSRLVSMIILGTLLGCGDSTDPAKAAEQFLSAGNAVRQTDPAKALALYRQALDADDSNAIVLNNFLLLSAESGNHDDAVAALNRLKEIDPRQAEQAQSFIADWSLSFLGGGHIELDMGELDSAAGNYDLFIKYNPLSEEGYIGRGNVLTERGQFEAAEQAFDKAFNLNAKAGMAFVGRGYLRVKQEQWAAAIEDLNAAIEIFPDHYPAYESRAVAFDSIGKPELAQLDREKSQSLQNERSDLTK